MTGPLVTTYLSTSYHETASNVIEIAVHVSFIIGEGNVWNTKLIFQGNITSEFIR